MRKALLHFLVFAFGLSAFAQDGGYTRQKMWERDMADFADIDQRQSPPKDPIVFAGSSTIRLWTSLRTDFPKHNVMNRGFGGSKLEDLVYFAPTMVAPYKPKMIVVYSGENDIEAKDSPENALADFRAFVAFRDKELPGVPIVYLSMKPSVLRWAIWPEMHKANALIAAEARRHKKVKFVDIGEPMLGPGGSKPAADLFVQDGLHLSAKGYAIFRDALKPYIK